MLAVCFEMIDQATLHSATPEWAMTIYAIGLSFTMFSKFICLWILLLIFRRIGQFKIRRS